MIQPFPNQTKIDQPQMDADAHRWETNSDGIYLCGGERERVDDLNTQIHSLTFAATADAGFSSPYLCSSVSICG
jgi:hypothetical protein